MWNCTPFRHLTDEQLQHVDIYILATTIICSLSTLNTAIQCSGGLEKCTLFECQCIETTLIEGNIFTFPTGEGTAILCGHRSHAKV